MRPLAFFIQLVVFFCISVAQAGEVSVKEGHIRETIPGTTTSSAYMVITNQTDQDVSLIGASSPVSPRLELHEHTMEGDMMRMGKIDSILVSAKGQVTLQPSGLHIMIFELKAPLKEDQRVPVTLKFENHDSIEVELPVVSIKRHRHNH